MGCFWGLRLRSSRGMAMEAERLPGQIDLKTIQMPKKKISFPCDYRRILLIVADCG